MTYPDDGSHCVLAAVGKDFKLTPAGVHIHGGQSVEVFPLALSPKRHKAHLQESWSRLLLVRERPHRDLVVKKGPRLDGRAPPQGLQAGGYEASGRW